MKETLRFVLAAALIFCFSAIALYAQSEELKLDTGEQIFHAACAGCHGSRGQGQPKTTLGFEPPATFPDFSDCGGSTRERRLDWKATILEGGHGRGFSEIMPSFAEALTLDQIDRVSKYLRTLCGESAWPLGELNFPRAILTEKAFPEDEAVITGAATINGERSVSGEIIYEKRLGVKNQLEFSVPLNYLKNEAGTWVGGVGDFVLGYKRVAFHSSKTGSILSFQGEVAAPTGNHSRGLGNGQTTFEVFGAFGQVLPKQSFLQLQSGAELPSDPKKISQVVFSRMALGKTLAGNRGFGRAWTPMVEVAAERDLETGAKINWDVVPQMQVTLNRRQHIRASIGYQKPVRHIAGRSKQIVFYLLWDWFDGGLREGW